MALIDENASLEEVQAVFKNDHFATRRLRLSRGGGRPRACGHRV